jgi:bisphosphoglycerate-dependent phosphoglycerate mutase
MILWILNSDSGIKLLYKSFLKTDADEDIVSGFLTAFHHFSMEEFHQSLDSIEMGGLRWIYILEPKFKLLFVAAGIKSTKTAILMGRLNVIKEAFLKEFEPVWIKKKRSWNGNMNVYLPFLKVIEDYYGQWEEVESINQVADFFDILGVFQQIFIILRNILEKRMYNKSTNIVLQKIEKVFKQFREQEKFKNQPELENITFSKESWFNIVDISLLKSEKDIVIKFLKSILTEVVKTLKEVKNILVKKEYIPIFLIIWIY